MDPAARVSMSLPCGSSEVSITGGLLAVFESPGSVTQPMSGVLLCLSITIVIQRREQTGPIEVTVFESALCNLKRCFKARHTMSSTAQCAPYYCTVCVQRGHGWESTC